MKKVADAILKILRQRWIKSTVILIIALSIATIIVFALLIYNHFFQYAPPNLTPYTASNPFSNILLVSAAGLLILLVIFSLNYRFIRAIITPVSEITKMSKRIADGSYGIQIQNIYRDEMGEMVGSINEMSLKIAQSEKIKTEFISSISHELRTPLTAITGWGETLVYSENLDEESKRGIAIMLKEARRLTQMVEDLLEFTQIEDGRFTLNIEPVDIAAELEDAIYTYRELLQRDKLEFNYHNDLNEELRIPGDPNRLKQVFLNLFDNAAKYGREGKRIDVAMKSDERFVKVSIRDYGEGVPADELANIKMKFYKGSNAKDRGSGIGLAVCEEIVEYHGGNMHLQNAQGGGFIVTVSLPIDSSVPQSKFSRNNSTDDFAYRITRKSKQINN